MGRQGEGLDAAGARVRQAEDQVRHVAEQCGRLDTERTEAEATQAGLDARCAVNPTCVGSFQAKKAPKG